MKAHARQAVSTAQLAVIALLASGLLWGLMWMPLKHFARHGFQGAAMTLCTYGVVGVLALPVVWSQRASWRPQWHLFALVGILGAAANICFVTALATGEVVRAMLLFYLAPVWSVLGGGLFLRERLSAVRAVAVVLAIAGAFLVLGGPTALREPLAPPDALALASGLLYSAQNIASRAADRVPVVSKALAVFAGCTLVSGTVLVAAGRGLPPVAGPLGLQLAAFGLVWIMAAMLTTMYGVTHLEAGRAGVLLVFELVAAVVSAMLIAGERLSGIGWIGAALICGAALLETRTASSPERSPP